jgi:hypothetical protein
MDRPIKLNSPLLLLLATILVTLGIVYAQDLGGGIQQPSSGGGGGGASATLRRVTAATDLMTTSDGVIVCSAASNSVTDTMPVTPSQYQVVQFKRVDSTSGNTCTLAANSGQNIEGNSTVNVPTNTAYELHWESATSTWWIF